jgi:hypothetical protein
MVYFIKKEVEYHCFLMAQVLEIAKSHPDEKLRTVATRMNSRKAKTKNPG